MGHYKRYEGVNIMSEQQKALIEVQKDIRINTANLKTAKLSVIMCEVNIKTYQKQLLKLEELHKDKMNRIQLQVNRHVKNLKSMHKTLDDLVAEKETLHARLKQAIHHGEVLCEYCGKYFTSQGLSRHKNTCISKPANKIVEKHKEEIEDIKDDIEARKAALEKELAKLKSIKK